MSDLIVNVQQGKIRGKLVEGFKGIKFRAFLGIPYAKPPLGNLRFKAPLPAEKWSGIKDCIEDNPGCYSKDLIYQTLAGSEDCLTLNVFTQEESKTTSLKPVMVWIHGGAYTAGSSKSDVYGPDFLITENVILVTINYRLGLLGFLTFDDPTLEVPGNAGLKDQVLALQWVQDNIKNFGGDPNNVTIFGESAGGTSIHYLILSPMAKGLFHKAIAQSGCCLVPWAVSRNPLYILAEILGLPFKTDQELFRYFQELPVEKLFEAQEQIPDDYKSHVMRALGPIIEKPYKNQVNFITEHPLDIIKKGTFNKVPFMLGFTSMEGFFYQMVEMRHGNSTLVKNFEEAIPNTFNIQLGTDKSRGIAKKIKEFYYKNEEPTEENKEKFFLMQTDLFFVHGIYQSARYHSKYHPVYLYKFSVDGLLNLYKTFMGITLPGAAHADEIGYLFKLFLTPEDLELDSMEYKTIKRMTKLWATFAKTGNPNPTEKDEYINDINWKPVENNQINYLDIGPELKTYINPEKERMEFWDNIQEICETNSKL
nr:esterase B1-like [Onthophagus taurus]XP_022902609.1 esterase B1-like [Onthophagus taurus]